MELIFLIPLAIVGFLLFLFVLQMVFLYGRLLLWRVQDSFTSFNKNLRERSDQAVDEVQRKARKREFLRWLDAKIGADGSAGSAKGQILEAQRQTPILRRLVEVEVPEATLRCAKVHRLTALAAGAVFIREVAYEPECYALRERVVDLVEAAVEKIGAYYFLLDNDDLLQNHVVLRKRILPTCRDCPYLNYAVNQAPLLCPSAEATGVKVGDVECHVGRKQQR